MVAEFITHLQGVKATAKGYSACCPAHDDRHPSLAIAEAEDRLLIHCRAGCSTKEVLTAVGLEFSDLFLDVHKRSRTRHRTSLPQSERVRPFSWDWRSQCAELERATQTKREWAEKIITATKGFEINVLTDAELDELMAYVCNAHGWLDHCERLDDALFLLQGALRLEEQQTGQIKKHER